MFELDDIYPIQIPKTYLRLIKYGMALKRHESLQGYSREHHDELLLVWKINEGLKKKISIERIIDYCIFHFKEMLSKHMEREEKYILSKLADDDFDKKEILFQHQTIKALFKKLEDSFTNKKELLLEIADKLEKHIRLEERVFFPRIQNDFSEEILKTMRPNESELKECTLWNDPFWEKEKI